MSADDQRIADAVARVVGEPLTVMGRAEHGTSGGAVHVTGASSGASMITWCLCSADHAARTQVALRRAYRAGLPVPVRWRPVPTDLGLLIHQDLLPGSPPVSATPAVIESVVDLNDRCAGLADPALPRVRLCLSGSGDPHPRHKVLAGHSPRSRRILTAVLALGRGASDEVDGDDLVHPDLDLSNVLIDPSGSVTGLVDWNLGALRGDRHVALIKTRFELEWLLHEPEVADETRGAARRLDGVIADRLDDRTAARYWAHRLLSQLHWVLQTDHHDVIDWALAVAEDRLT